MYQIQGAFEEVQGLTDSISGTLERIRTLKTQIYERAKEVTLKILEIDGGRDLIEHKCLESLYDHLLTSRDFDGYEPEGSICVYYLDSPPTVGVWYTSYFSCVDIESELLFKFPLSYLWDDSWKDPMRLKHVEG